MENNFDSAKQFLNEFFSHPGRSLDYHSATKALTEYAAKFAPAAIQEVGNEALTALQAEFKAKIDEMEQKLAEKEQAHQEAINAYKVQLASRLPENLPLAGEAPVTDAPVEPKVKKAKA